MRTLIVASSYERARNYARKHGYHTADVVGGDVNQLRGRHSERVIIVGDLDDHTIKVLAPTLSSDTEVLYATETTGLS